MQTIRIKLKGYDSAVVDIAAQQIIESSIKTGAKVAGPIPLPTKIKKWTVLESPFIDKRAQEAFEMRIHKRLLEIIEPNAKTIEILTQLQLPAGVGIEIK